MAENDNLYKANLVLIRDPNTVNKRIFIGNLPTCTRDELESICAPYGKVLASLLQKNFGFVQYDSEETAIKAASALNKSSFKGNNIVVRIASDKQKKQAAVVAANWQNNAPQPTSAQSATATTTENGNYNDCEIIVVDRKNTKYAEMIEDRLKRLNLRVDVLFPNEDVPLGKVLSNIASRGCLYAILVTNQHEEHNSITVNILYGQPAEHRNMPVDDAIKLIATDISKKRFRDNANAPPDAVQQQQPPIVNHLPNPVPIIPAFVTPTANERPPHAIQTLINLLANNMPLTVLQYDRIIKHLQERRELQVRIELGADATKFSQPDPEIELQRKILDILNKPSVAETHYELLYPNIDAVQADYRLMELLKDGKVQKALDSLMDTNLVSTVENLMKF